MNNAQASPAALYKRAFFLDWRAADRHKLQLFNRIDFLLDTNRENAPRMIGGELFREALRAVVRQPFSVVPFFDPGPWGGHWMKDNFDLPDGPPNYAWCFNCVPEENSLLLAFGSREFEIPSLDVVFSVRASCWGTSSSLPSVPSFPFALITSTHWVVATFRSRFIRSKSYIREHFGMDYTQDESYYMLQAADDAVVYLGLRKASIAMRWKGRSGAPSRTRTCRSMQCDM